MSEERRKLPPHESALRVLVHESKKLRYKAYRSLDEARANPDGAVVFEADCGGTIYLTIPAGKVLCGDAQLNQMLADLDAMYWNDEKSRRVYYERLPIGSGVFGGMGGGRIIDGLWLHEKMEEFEIRDEIQAVLDGSRKRISSLRKRRK